MSAKVAKADDPIAATKNSLRRHTEFLNFCDAVQARLEKGAVTYGDQSFNVAPSVLLEELQQEALDLAGWGFILWRRLEAFKAEAAK